MLYYANNDIFVTGVMDYEFRPVDPDNSIDVSKRILLQVHIEGIPAVVAIDTGAPYLILSPSLTDRLTLDENMRLEEATLKIRGVNVQGRLFRLAIQLPAVEGEDYAFEATAFAPNPDEEERWGNLPTYLGIEYCLERIRFAIDPEEDKFYFGGFGQTQL